MSQEKIEKGDEIVAWRWNCDDDDIIAFQLPYGVPIVIRNDRQIPIIQIA